MTRHPSQSCEPPPCELTVDTVEIRAAIEEDVAAIRELVREAYAVYIPRIGREPAPMGADYAALVDYDRVWVAQERGVIIGVVVLVPQRDALLLENVAVAPKAQGRGVGRALIAFSEAKARELGLNKVTLYTNEHMTENLVLYPRLGYVEVARRRAAGFDRVYFEKAMA